MSESNYEQTIALVKSALQGIASDGGVTYWYTPDRVVKFPKLSAECLNTPDQVVYVISPDIEPIEAGTMTMDKSTAVLDLSLCQRFEPTSENPFDPPDPDRETIQSRMAQDVMTAMATLWRAQSIAGGTINIIRCKSVNRRAEDTVFPGYPWAVAFLRIEVDFYYTDTTP